MSEEKGHDEAEGQEADHYPPERVYAVEGGGGDVVRVVVVGGGGGGVAGGGCGAGGEDL